MLTTKEILPIPEQVVICVLVLTEEHLAGMERKKLEVQVGDFSVVVDL